jgi:hypothetical protein
VISSRGVENEINYKQFRSQQMPVMLGDEDVKHILLSCSDTTTWRMEFQTKND